MAGLVGLVWPGWCVAGLVVIGARVRSTDGERRERREREKFEIFLCFGFLKLEFIVFLIFQKKKSFSHFLDVLNHFFYF